MARRPLRAALALALALAAGGAARAHRVAPEEVVALLGGADARERLGVDGAARDPRLPRLLVVRVGPRWEALDPELRREAAEAWRELWRHAVPDGVLAVADADGRSLVGFDAAGRARLLAAPRDAGAPARPGGRR